MKELLLVSSLCAHRTPVRLSTGSPYETFISLFYVLMILLGFPAWLWRQRQAMYCSEEERKREGERERKPRSVYQILIPCLCQNIAYLCIQASLAVLRFFISRFISVLCFYN